MTPVARRTPSSRHRGQRVGEVRLPVAHADVDRQRRTDRREQARAWPPGGTSARSAASVRRSARSGARPPRGARAECGRPRMTLSRNGRISSGAGRVRRRRSAGRRRSTPSRAARRADSSCTASTQRAHVIDRRRRQDAVTEVEDVPRSAGRLAEDARRRALRISGIGASSAIGSRLPCTATSWPRRAHAASRSTRQSRPMTSPPASRRHSSRPAVPVPKWITGTPGRDRRDQRAHVRQHVRAVVGGREAADPAVEELHGLRRPAAICAFR